MKTPKPETAILGDAFMQISRVPSYRNRWICDAKVWEILQHHFPSFRNSDVFTRPKMIRAIRTTCGELALIRVCCCRFERNNLVVEECSTEYYVEFCTKMAHYNHTYEIFVWQFRMFVKEQFRSRPDSDLEDRAEMPGKYE